MLNLIMLIFAGGILGFFISLKRYGVKDKEVEPRKLKNRILFLESMNSYLLCTLAFSSLLISALDLEDVHILLLLTIEVVAFFLFTCGSVYLYFSKDVMTRIKDKKLENEEKVSTSELYK